jgi:hypothetical protein
VNRRSRLPSCEGWADAVGPGYVSELRYSVFDIRHSIFLFLVIAGSLAADVSFVWDASLVATSMPRGTGQGIWRSPDPVPTDAFEYYLTTKVFAVAEMLTPFLGTWVEGERAEATNFGQLTSLPFSFFDETVCATDVRSFLTIPITSVASSRGHVYVGTDSHVYYELSGFVVTNTTLAMRMPVMVSMTGHTNEGRGIFLSVIPEPSAALGLLLTFLGCTPRRCQA